MPALVSRGRGRRTINEINMVPFIDVMLVLLIIFMVTAPLISPSVIDLPSVGKGSALPDRVVQIIVNKDESLALKLNSPTGRLPAGADTPQAVTLQTLVARVRAGQEGQSTTPVVISADRAVKYESVVKVMDTLQRAGVQRVGLAVQLAP